MNGNKVPKALTPFGERLTHLMQTKGIKNAHQLANELIKNKIVPTAEGSISDKTLDSTRKGIQDHLYDPQKSENVSGRWLRYYCDYFGCSADFLIGKISETTHAKRDICSRTQLSENAAASLIGLSTPHSIALSAMLESPKHKELLIRLFAYLQAASQPQEDKTDFWSLSYSPSDQYLITNPSTTEAQIAEHQLSATLARSLDSFVATYAEIIRDHGLQPDGSVLSRPEAKN